LFFFCVMDALVDHFKVRLVGQKVYYFLDDHENIPLVSFANVVKALVRNVTDDEIVGYEDAIMENDAWFSDDQGHHGGVFVALDHCEEVLSELVDDMRAVRNFKEWQSTAEEELDAAAEKREQTAASRKGKRRKKRKAQSEGARKQRADWAALIHNRHRKKRRAQDEDYNPPVQEEEDDDAWMLDALIEAMSEEPEEGAASPSPLSVGSPEEEEDPIEDPDQQQPHALPTLSVEMTWNAKKDFVSFHMETVREMRALWTTFKDTDPQIAGTAITMINNSLRAIGPFWPAQHTDNTRHKFVDDADDPRDPPTSISQRLTLRGYDPSKLSVDQFKRIGTIAARLYEDVYGARPEVTHRQYDGQWRSVNKYKRSRARLTIDKAIRQVLG